METVQELSQEIASLSAHLDAAAHHKLDLGPDVNLPQWDGKTPDYDGAVVNAPEYGCSDGCWQLASSRWALAF